MQTLKLIHKLIHFLDDALNSTPSATIKRFRSLSRDIYLNSGAPMEAQLDLPSLSKAVIEARHVETSTLLKNFTFKLIRLEIFVDLDLNDQLSILSSIHNLILVIFVSNRKNMDLALKLPLHNFRSTQVLSSPAQLQLCLPQLPR